MTKKEQLRMLTDEYLPAFLGFAINKAGDISESEELAQEIAFQCVIAINHGDIRENFNSYIWGVAHNTFKRWYGRDKFVTLNDETDTFSNIISDELPIVDRIVSNEETNTVRLCISKLAGDYRKVIVCFYFDELSIHEIGRRLGLSEGMVKFYLRAGKMKLREVFSVSQIGEKSINPSEFTIYKSAIDFSKVNIWEVFKRKLPCQIAIICHDTAKTISEISLETGTPAVYIEDEVELLYDTGLIINPVKGKYRTNFHILQKNAAAQLKEQFMDLYKAYSPHVLTAYEKYLPQLKKCGVFKHDATDTQWAWFFAQNVSDFDYEGYGLSADDYPQILSCGSKAVIFAEETKGSPWARGQTPTFLDKCTVYPCDVVAFGEYHRQKELRNKHKAQALYDVYRANLKDEDKELYAELIEQGYVTLRDGELYCNIAVSTTTSRELFNEINEHLSDVLKNMCQTIRQNITRIIKATLPHQLHAYIKGYTETWISFYAGVYLFESLCNDGMITVPEKNDITPVACWLYENN
jgi:RNA polymerase sigma factor (sigma-70 family)